MPAFFGSFDRRRALETFDHSLGVDEIVIQVDDNGDRDVCRWHWDFDLGIVVKYGLSRTVPLTVGRTRQGRPQRISSGIRLFFAFDLNLKSRLRVISDA